MNYKSLSLNIKLKLFSLILWCAYWTLFSSINASLTLNFEHEPSSVMVEADNKRAVFRCSVNIPNAYIRWLWNGVPVEEAKPRHISLRTRRQKLVVRISRKEKRRSHSPSKNDHFQCIAYHQGRALVSRPAKLIVGELQPFPSANDVTLSVIAGNTAVIPCVPPHGIPQVITEFTFNDTKIELSGRHQRQPSGDLQILDAQLVDSGTYRCSAYNPLTQQCVEASYQVFLTVTNETSPIPPSFIVTPNISTSVVLGGNVTLECVAVGVPPPNITWLKKYGQLHKHSSSQIGGNLLLLAVRREDEGMYTCLASNGVGPEATWVTSLEVNEVPLIINPPESQEIEEGKSLTLKCGTKGQPKPSVSWLHDGIRVIKDQWVTLKEDMLIIKRISWKHSGIYQCFATNQLDTTWASCVVTVTERNGTTLHHDLLYDVDTTEGNLPGLDEDDGSEALEKNYAMLVPPSRPDLTPLSDDSVMVRWTVHHNDGLPILFFKVQYKISGGHWMTIDEDIAPHIHSYAVTELEPGTSYRFRIAAVYSNYDNNHGPSSSYMLSKDPPMKKPVIGPIILLAKAESPSAITIQWVYNDMGAVPIEGFFIHYRTTHTAGDYTKVTVLGSNTHSQTITHLLPDTSYDFKMQCFNYAGTSGFSNILTAKTLFVTTDDYQADQHDMETKYNNNGGNIQERQVLFLVLGIVLGVMLLVLFVFLILYIIRQRQKKDLTKAGHVYSRSKYLSNGHVITANGHIPSEEMVNVSINPLVELNTDESVKALEFSEVPSNNNMRNKKEKSGTLLKERCLEETSFISTNQS